MLEHIRNLVSRRDEQAGASAVEYGLLVALIAAVIVIIVLSLGGVVKEAFSDTCTGITQSTSVDASCNS